MALIFNCPNCGKEIQSKYLRIGEECKCVNCLEYCIIPESADVTGEEATLVKHLNETHAKITDSKYTDVDYKNIQYPLAERGARLAAYILDVIIFQIPYIIVSSLVAPNFVEAAWYGDYRPLIIHVYITIVFIIVSLFIHGYFLTTRGQSLGKMIVKIKIVLLKNGQNGGFVPNVLLRGIVNSLLCIIPFYALVDIFFIFSADTRCLHDHIAGTIVVSCREKQIS